jgi:hypothetical protein
MGAVTSAGTRTTTKTYERPEPGVYPARCIQTVELGFHPNRFFNPEKDNPESEYRKELLIVWELGELMQDGRPFVISWRDRNLLSEKSNLYKLLTGWRGKPFTEQELKRFDLNNILDKCCYLNLVESAPDKNGKTWINVESAIPLPKGMACDPRYNDLIDFSIEDIGTPLFGQLYPWVQDYIKKSLEWQAYANGQVRVTQPYVHLPAEQVGGECQETVPF